MMRYKDYIGDVEYDDRAKIFHREVVNTRDAITFQGKTVEELDQAFRDSIEDYLSWCKEDAVQPGNQTVNNASTSTRNPSSTADATDPLFVRISTNSTTGIPVDNPYP